MNHKGTKATFGSFSLCTLCLGGFLGRQVVETTMEMGARANELSNRIIGAAIEVHRELGPGLLESAYRRCLCRELELEGISFEPEVKLPVTYKGVDIDCAYGMDIKVAGLVIVEIKCVEKLDRVHEAQ